MSAPADASIFQSAQGLSLTLVSALARLLDRRHKAESRAKRAARPLYKRT